MAAKEAARGGAQKGGGGKGSAPSKKKAEKGIWQVYTVSGEKLERRTKHCPKCGPGVFMAKHENRSVCGRCGYGEFGGK